MTDEPVDPEAFLVALMDEDQQVEAGETSEEVDLLRALTRHEAVVVRNAVTRNEHTLPALLDVLAGDEDWVVRAHVAMASQASRSTLTRLAADEHWAVRLNVVRNPGLPDDVLLRLRLDEDDRVVGLAHEAVAERGIQT